MHFLDTLNGDQRRAAEFDITGGEGTYATRPLLVIAGAGSGKTTTLASRVANLIVNGCSRDRILLLTFSRRAANEMTDRVRRIVQSVEQSGGARWPTARSAGPARFMPVGARLSADLCQSYRTVNPEFSIHDREDSGRSDESRTAYDLGLSEKSIRFPLKSTCLRDLLISL